MITTLPKDKRLILFDGVCNLCNSTVVRVIKQDKKDVFRFAPLQSEIGKDIISNYNINTEKTDSIILYSQDAGVCYKSSAVLKIASKLGFPYKMLAVFFIVPPVIRNWVYDYIAKNRYKWYGKKDVCMIPTPELKSKFLQ